MLPSWRPPVAGVRSGGSQARRLESGRGGEISSTCGDTGSDRGRMAGRGCNQCAVTGVADSSLAVPLFLRRPGPVVRCCAALHQPDRLGRLVRVRRQPAAAREHEGRQEGSTTSRDALAPVVCSLVVLVRLLVCALSGQLSPRWLQAPQHLDRKRLARLLLASARHEGERYASGRRGRRRPDDDDVDSWNRIASSPRLRRCRPLTVGRTRSRPQPLQQRQALTPQLPRRPPLTRPRRSTSRCPAPAVRRSSPARPRRAVRPAAAVAGCRRVDSPRRRTPSIQYQLQPQQRRTTTTASTSPPHRSHPHRAPPPPLPTFAAHRLMFSVLLIRLRRPRPLDYRRATTSASLRLVRTPTPTMTRAPRVPPVRSRTPP